MKAVESNPDEYLYSNIYDGLQRLEEAKTVIYASESLIRTVNKADQMVMSNVTTFGQEKYEYWGVLFTMNSPLLPMFRKATSKTFENGIFKRGYAKWLGDEIKSQGAVGTIMLSMGQTFIAFLFMVLFIFLSLFTLFLELLFKGSSKMSLGVPSGPSKMGLGVPTRRLDAGVLQEVLNY